LTTTINPTSAQKKYKFSKEQYRRKASGEFIIGGILIVGGTIGTISHGPSTWTLKPSANSEFGFFGSNEMEIQMNLWPAAIVGGSLVSLMGLNHLIKSNRVAPLVEIQKIPGLDKIGIVYPKLPAIGIKYRL
jgi:hypothetical protein